MNGSPINLIHLAAFHAVAEEGNVTRAAERLGISQPAVSKSVRELEKSLGLALFHRLSTGVRLTESGALLHDYSRRLFALEAEAREALRELRALERGRLHIGASTLIGDYWLPALCAQFRLLHPGLDVRLDIAPGRAIQKRLIEGEFDLALCDGPALLPELVAEPLAHDALLAIAAPGHILLGRERALREVALREVALEDAMREPMIGRESGSGVRDGVEAVWRERDLPVPRVMELGGLEAVKRGVMAGGAWAIVPRSCAHDELQRGALCEIPLRDPLPPHPLHRLRLRGRYETRAAREFARLLRGGLTVNK